MAEGAEDSGAPRHNNRRLAAAAGKSHSTTYGLFP
jgi:hypothetical protein